MERNYDFAKQVWSKMEDRYSCRSFSDEKIPEDILRDILKAGIRAASGGNLQPCSVIVVRDKERKKALYDACEQQKFIEDADTDLIFLMDWHKYSIYTKKKDAPFVADRALNHFLIALEDIMCMAQTIESAAHIGGIESCYVGSVIGAGKKLKEILNLPDGTYPMVMLSMGYPSVERKNRIKKLDYDFVVFNEQYPNLSDEDIFRAYEKKFEGMKTPLPSKEPNRSEMLREFRNALRTSYSEEDTDRIVRTVEERGYFNETQRRFGLHYKAHELFSFTKHIIDEMKEMNINPFDIEK